MSFSTTSGPGMTIGVSLYRATRENQWTEDLSQWLIDGAVDLNLDRAVKLGGSFTLTSDASVTPYRDYLAPVLTIEYEDGSPSVTYQLGLFSVRTPQSSRTLDSTTVTYVGTDLCQVLADDSLTAPVSFSAGTPISRAVLSLITSDAVDGATGPLSASRVSIPTSIRTLNRTRTFPTGKPRLEAANELLTSISWYSLSTTLEGIVTTSGRYRRLSVMEPWRVLTPFDLVAPLEDTSQDTQVFNVVVATKDNGNEAPLTSTVSNDDPSSPTSTVTLGRKIVRLVSVSDSVTQDDLDELADRVLEESRSFYRTVKVTILPDPTALYPHQCFDLIGTGLLSGYTGRYWIRTASMGLKATSATVQIGANQVLLTDTGVQV